jgi:hypothetical protein
MTRIKMERRNLEHKILIDKMDQWLRARGALPQENDHIDLTAAIPEDGAYIFEMKSGGESLLDQIRKGLSQLYEYRFRYRAVFREDIGLCLVLPGPLPRAWLTNYLCDDRAINVCWFDEVDNLAWPAICDVRMHGLRAAQIRNEIV